MWTRQEYKAGADKTCGRSADNVQFLSAWLADPFRTAAIAPSGRRLSRLITQEICPQTSPVLELGAGTGAFTHALLERGIAEHELTLVEMSPQFAGLLRTRFPKARVVEANAAQLIPTDLFSDRLAGAAISGLGLLSMHPRTVRAILSNTFSCLRPKGCLYQFTYGPRCPVQKPILNRLGLEAERIGGTWVNLPPAAVYRIRRKAPPTAGPCAVDLDDEVAMSRKRWIEIDL